MTASNILILGGSGFLSSAVARVALAAGHAVWAVSRGQRTVPPGVRGLVADRKERETFAQVIGDAGVEWDLVIDCIGFDADDARQDLDVFSPRAGHLIFISTDFVLDPVDRPWQVDETYAKLDTRPYGAGKRAAEELLLSAPTGGMRISILRPNHIYGIGSQLGCLPAHGRDPELIARMKRGETLKLVGGGFFLQQPVHCDDVARMALSCAGNERTDRQIYMCPGPDTIASWEYYRIIADALGVMLRIEELPIAEYLNQRPEHGPFCAHRVYSTAKGISHGLEIGKMRLAESLPAQVHGLLL
jgi:nucleoside-diphosphate-sugar epimerase